MPKNSRRSDLGLAEALSEFIDLVNAGAAPSVDEFLSEHKAVASQLGPLLRSALTVRAEASQAAHAPNAALHFENVRKRLLDEKEKQASARNQQVVAPSLAIDKRPDFLLLLLRAAGEIRGVTRVFKLLFLLGKEGDAARFVRDYYTHVAYSYGPFEDNIYKDLEALERRGLIEAEKPPNPRLGWRGEVHAGVRPTSVEAVYTLTKQGKKIADALAKGAEMQDPTILENVRRISGQYGRMPLKKLLAYVYRKYPEFATKSVIRDEVLGADES